MVRERRNTLKKKGLFIEFYYRCRTRHIVKGNKIKSDCRNSCIRKDEIEDFVYQRNALTSFGVENIAVIKDEK